MQVLAVVADRYAAICACLGLGWNVWLTQPICSPTVLLTATSSPQMSTAASGDSEATYNHPMEEDLKWRPNSKDPG
ncbi:hypothetical protein [Oryza sativa Japonica Group]|uniref:Uncharacterized protein n=1 Tax=Oryza sativa subsp. japonica TaxID=39947 RepID=Q656R4_ORYSJ|nr:hypothetical protein [Oryza sativa Japonica Group]